MTEFDKYFIKTIEILDSYKVDYFIHGSTLLGKIRNNCLLQRDGILHDKELNFGMMAEDFTPSLFYRLQRDNPYFECHSGVLPSILTFFGRHEKREGYGLWTLPSFSLIALFWPGKTKVIEYMGSDIALTWPKEHLIDKSKWETVEILGKKVKTPYLKEKWLSHYYGKDFMEEKKYWHYTADSFNRESFEKLIKEGEICL